MDFSLSKAYQSTTPCSCRTLKKRWDEYHYQYHRQKVANARPYVDNRPPKTFPHLYERLKRYVMEEQKCYRIQRDNYLLLRRMTEIMQNKGPIYIDNYNDYEIKSMNGPLRQRELLRLAQENQAILARIDASRPHYCTKQMLQEWRDKKMYADLNAKFVHTGAHHRKKLKIIKLGKSPAPGVSATTSNSSKPVSRAHTSVGRTSN